MAPRTPRQRSTPNVSELHRAWLELVDTDGPFLAIPPLKRVWPQGMPALDGDRKEALLYARKDFEAAWETADRATGDDGTTDDAYRIARDKWVETVLRDVVGWAESLSWGPVAGITAQSPNRAVTVGAQAALLDPDGAIGALVSVIDPVDSLRQVPYRPVGGHPGRPDRSAAARERHSDRHRHRRTLVGTGVRTRRRDDRLRRRRRADLGRGNPHPRRLPRR